MPSRASSVSSSRAACGCATEESSAANGPGGRATAFGQITALIGTYTVLVQLLLMSRVPWIERAIGLDRLAVWHRWLGFATVSLLTAHVVFTTVGYAQGDHVSLWYQTGDFVSHYPDVLMAWVGFALFIAVAVTSVRAARRKLSRETWYFVHLYAYLAIALTFAHQLAVGTDFDSDPAGSRVVGRSVHARVRHVAVVARRRAGAFAIGGIASASKAFSTKHRASRRSTSAVATSTSSTRNRASSSCGGSSLRADGGSRIPSRSRPRRPATCCGSR